MESAADRPSQMIHKITNVEATRASTMFSRGKVRPPRVSPHDLHHGRRMNKNDKI